MVIDLDGTYIQGNTLHIYLRCAINYHLRHFHLLRAAHISWLLTLRSFGAISHVDMKFPALALAGRDETLLNYFTRSVLPLVHPKVEALRQEYEERGGLTLLATAAADFYIPRIWSGDYVATRADRNPEKMECRGPEKLRRVQEWLDAHHARIAVVITDHVEDLPLVRANERGINYLVQDNEIIPFREEDMAGA
jgi:phosphoserine phosphatase